MGDRLPFVVTLLDHRDLSDDEPLPLLEHLGARNEGACPRPAKEVNGGIGRDGQRYDPDGRHERGVDGQVREGEEHGTRDTFPRGGGPRRRSVAGVRLDPFRA
jgi:hypothetical protein